VLAAFVSMVRLAEGAIDECVGGNAHCAEDDSCLSGGIASRNIRKLANEKIS
jgi:hypothetical protein